MPATPVMSTPCLLPMATAGIEAHVVDPGVRYHRVPVPVAGGVQVKSFAVAPKPVTCAAGKPLSAGSPNKVTVPPPSATVRPASM